MGGGKTAGKTTSDMMRVVDQERPGDGESNDGLSTI